MISETTKFRDLHQPILDFYVRIRLIIVQVSAFARGKIPIAFALHSYWNWVFHLSLVNCAMASI